MEFSLSEDDIAIDCLNFVDKTPNAIIMREGCDAKTSYPDAPPPPMPSSISNMLNDEAPDNLFSSAALEKNVFSDDDEFGLQPLKKSNKNFEKPTWEMEFDTDDVIKKNSDLGLDLVNFPPPPPVSSPQIQMESGPSEMKHESLEFHKEEITNADLSFKINEKMDEEEQILYEVTTDSLVTKQDKKLDVDDSFCMDYQNDCHMSKDPDMEDDVMILEALNDHNYTSCKISFHHVAQYTINDMTPAEESCLLDLLASRRRDHGATFLVKNEKSEVMSDSDDTVSNASTVCFPYTGDNQTREAETAAEAESDGDDDHVDEKEEDENDEDEKDDDENDEDEKDVDEKDEDEKDEDEKNEDGKDEEQNREDENENDYEVPDKTVSSRTICKEELDIVDQPDQNDISEGMSETIAETSDDKTQPSIDNAEVEEEAHDDIRSSENHESQITDSESPQKSNPQSSTEECSTPSALFSENRSEPNEFYDTEENSSDSETDKKKAPESLEHAEADLVQNDTNLSATDKAKLNELQTFANRLLSLCIRPDTSANLDKLMDELYVDFRSILGRGTCTDMSTQTERIISKERRTRMNEKAKKRLLNASSSSDSCSSSDYDDEEMDDFQSNTHLPNNNEASDVEIEENAADEDKLEKSPSYSDLSVAGSEEFLNMEGDDIENPSVCDGVDLSKYVVPSPGKSTVAESEDLDLSKYEVKSDNLAEKSKADDTSLSTTVSQVDVSSEYVPLSEDTLTASESTVKEVVESDKDNDKIDDNVPEFQPSTSLETAVDEEMPEISTTDDKLEDANNREDSDNDAIDDGGKSLEDIIETDDKLKADAVVELKKLSDEDLEDYYDNLRDLEIQKLLKFSGIKKLRLNDPVPSPSDKPQTVYKSKATKKLLEMLKEVENDMCSDDSNSDAEETQITEKQFLKMCNDRAKDDILKSSSSDSELESKESDDEELNAVSDSSDDEEGPSIVDKFLEKFATNIDDDGDDGDDQDDEEVVPAEVVSADVADVNDKTDEEHHKADVEVGKETPAVRVEETAEQDGIELESNAVQHDKQPVTPPDSAPTSAIKFNESTDDPSSDELSDDVVLVSADSPKNPTDESKEKVKSDSETRSAVSTPKPSTSRGLPRSLRNLLADDKEIDMDAIERCTPTLIDDVVEDINDIFDKSIRRPASNKSLETLFEESRRRQNSRSTDNVVTLDSDSDLEEVTVEPEVQKRTIKPMLRKDQLAGETRTAQRRESERIKRLEKKNETLASVVSESARSSAANGPSAERELILDYNTETKQFIKVHWEIVKHLKEHQFEGIKFMYDNTYGSVDHLKRNPGSGCILAHCMGLGKTLQIVALLHTVINHKELDTSKILVLCPKSTVMNWADEIKRWLGPLKLGLPKIYSFDNVSSSIEDKLKILHEWSQCGKAGFRKSGCLLLGYEAFRTLVLSPLHKKKQISQVALDKIKQKISDALLDPGADLVICDEGHIIKNRKAATSVAVSQIRTPRRIVLTGTPIQNNLKEYYAMVNFIKPKFLGTEKEFANLYENPIRNGQHKDSNKHDIKIMKQRSFVLHKKLSKFVQRREAALLEQFLPAKFEYVLFIPMTDVQINLYEYFLQESSKRESSRGKHLIPDYTCLRKIWTHPRVLENAWKNAVNKKRDQKKSPIREPNSDDEQPDDVYDTQTGALSVTDDWWRSMLSEDNLKSILPSSKLQVMFEILRMCTENGEKCLIFSAFVAVLDCVEYFMNEITKQSDAAREYGLMKYRGPWESGKDYYRLDGKTPKNIRHEMIKSFNDPHHERARVFLISAKAGGQGINLIGANRVMILDTSWNPSNDQQNIFRVFRLGQKRQCYVYRLLAMGTMEEKVYSRAVTKQAMSFRVVDEQQIDRHYSMAELAELYTLTKPDYQNRPVPKLPQDSILASLLRNSPHLVYKYHEHDSLLENRSEQELSEQEKNDAWEAYERDLQSSQNPEFIAAGLNSMQQQLYQNSGFPPGMGYGFPQDRNFPMGYGGGLPQGYYPPSAYTGNRSFIDMLKMFTGPPPNASIMSALNANPGANAQNNMHPYGPNAHPSTSTAPNSMPMNLPPFSSLQNIVASTGINSIPSFTSPFSSMANSYNLSADTALLRLSQMYASSLGVGGGSGGMPLPDSRSPPGRPTTNSPNTSNNADKRNTPFPTGILPPTPSADGIPTSVIKAPQVYGAPSARTPMPPAQMSIRPSAPGQYPKPTPAGNSNHITLQQQLLAQPRLPPPGIALQGLQPLMQQPIATSRNLADPPQRPPIETTVTKSSAFNPSVVNVTSSAIASVASVAINRNSSPITASSRHNSPVTASSRHNSPVTASARHNSPVTASSRQNSPQTKVSLSANAPRATNMGIVYPPENSSTTITPIPSPGASSSSGISVRSVSSINSTSGKNTIPATIIPKPGAVIPPHLTNIIKKTTGPNIAASGIAATSSISVSPINSKQPNLATRPGNMIEKPQKSANSSLLSQLRSPLQPAPEKKDKSKTIVGPINKASIPILGSNNVQLTKVTNSRSVLAQSQNNLGKPRAYFTPQHLKNQSGLQQQLSGSPGSMITKARSNSELTVVPVTNNAIDSSAKAILPNNSATVVPTLVPFSTKAMTITPANRPTVVTNSRGSFNTSTVNSASLGALTAKSTNSLLVSSKKPPINATRVSTPSAKAGSFDPLAVASTTTTPVKRTASLTNLTTAKQARSLINNSQISRQPASLLSNQQQGRLQTQSPASSAKTLQSQSPSNSNKQLLSIRNIDTINRFTNAGITISSGKSRGNAATNQNVLINQGNSSIKATNSSITSNVNNISSSVILSKVGTTARKRPPPNLVSDHLAAVDPSKRPRMGQSIVDRTVAESLTRARTNQGLTISVKNSQGNQRTKKDGKEIL